jgi:hypothetical protein
MAHNRHAQIGPDDPHRGRTCPGIDVNYGLGLIVAEGRAGRPVEEASDFPAQPILSMSDRADER